MAILAEASRAGSIRDVVRKYGIAEQTFYRWRRKYRDMSEVQAERLRLLEKEVTALRRRLQKAQQDNLMLKQALGERIPNDNLARIRGEGVADCFPDSDAAPAEIAGDASSPRYKE